MSSQYSATLFMNQPGLFLNPRWIQLPHSPDMDFLTFEDPAWSTAFAINLPSRGKLNFSHHEVSMYNTHMLMVKEHNPCFLGPLGVVRKNRIEYTMS